MKTLIEVCFKESLIKCPSNSLLKRTVADQKYKHGPEAESSLNSLLNLQMDGEVQVEVQWQVFQNSVRLVVADVQ